MTLYVYYVQEQYEFIYDVVRTKLRCGTTVINVADLKTLVQQLAAPSGRRTRLNGFDKQFKVSSKKSFPKPYASIERR